MKQTSIFTILISFSIMLIMINVQAQDTQKDDTAYQLLKTKCFICHNTGTSHDNMLAPPMMGVKNHYWDDNKEVFIKNMVEWVLKPSEDKVQMYGAVNRFNMMPNLSYNKEDVEKIVAYIYENEMDSPSFCGGGDEEQVKDPLEDLTLNNGKKWIVNQATHDGMTNIKALLTDYVVNDKTDHVNLAIQMSKESSTLISKCDMVGKDHDQLHIILSPILATIEEIKNSKNAQPVMDLSVYLAKYFEHFNLK